MNLMAAAVSMNLVRARAIPVYVPGARSSVMHLRRRNRTEFYGCLSVLVVVFAAHLWKIRGACQRKILGVNPTKSAAAANRAEIFDRRVHANRASSARPQDITNRIPSGSSTHSSIGPSTPVDDILALRMAAQSSGAAESKLAIQWTIQLANTDSGSIGKENGAMGKTMRALPESTSTQHVLEYMTWESRIAWKEAKNMWPLHPDYCTVRGHKNTTFPENGVNTLLKMYTWQKTNNPSAIVSNSSTRSKGSKTPGHSTMLLELLVFMDKYNIHTGGNGNSDSDEDGGADRKRRKRTAGGRVSQRRRAEEGSDFLPLTSKFVSEGRGDRSCQASRGHELDYTEIQFRRTEFSMEEDEEAANLDTVEGDVDEKGWLCDVPMVLEARDEGRSKVPYMLKIGNDSFVAKEVVNLGAKGKVTPHRAKAALVDELKRLEIAKWVMQNFKGHARENDIPLEPIDVTSAFLATLVPPSTPDPTLEADDMDGESIQSTNTRYFLVEPLRSTTTVRKFSGTLGARNASDILSGTITAFAHYAAQFLAAKMVFCDLQGSYHKSETETIFTLFDPMTHSIKGDSGPSDHGWEGIKAFLKSHKCSQHCKRLKLVGKPRLNNAAKAAAEADGIDWDEEDD